MAPSIPTTYAKFTLVLLIAIVVGHSNAEGRRMKETNMVLYLQDWVGGQNVTATTVAGINGTKSGVLSFGTITVIDHALTIGIDSRSMQVGRAQGIYVGAAMDGSSLHFLFSIVVTNGQYKGSTLEIQGPDPILVKQREVSVVSGTGMFRYGKGYVIIERVYFDPITLNAVLKFNVTVRYPVRSDMHK
ncbi:dirigent protein 22-like [Magnolia sinica]|uniref:dirigent protein 22-like n=1 Tax=Magnolia sinica TaxID=86752 RepID=UPI002658FFF4|nr:dirigent protein 22-like [Magnolia sinica]